ncbi:MAG: cation:proton antiporter [Solirubrobacterales bacterium]
MESTVVILAEDLMKIISLCIFTGIICMKIGNRVHIPDVVLFIFSGILLGPELLNLISFKNYKTGSQFILSFGAAYILYDGGREIRLKVLNKVKLSVLTLATLGVLITTFITGYFTAVVFHIPFIYALLLGSVIASTDPSVLVPLFKKVKISNKPKQTIISESAFNDAAAAIITFSIIGIIQGGNFSMVSSLSELMIKAIGGIAVGSVVGYSSTLLVSEKKYNFLNGYPGEMSVAAVIGAYFLAEHLHLSGFMAVFLVGIFCGNKETFRLSINPHHENLHLSFKDVLISLIRILIFIILGTQLKISILSLYFTKSLIVILAFIFIGRPVSVILSTFLDKPAKWNIRELAYLMWTRETGVIPAALAATIVSMNIAHAEIITSVTFMAIIITLTFQASTAGLAAKILKLDMD